MDFHPRESSRPRRAYSFEFEEGDSPTAALREGIHEAKETVHQMGDVLDTPRMTPQRRRSPTPRIDLGSLLGSSPHPTETTPSQTSRQSENEKPPHKSVEGGDRKKEKAKEKTAEKLWGAKNESSYLSSSSESSDSTLSQKRLEAEEEKLVAQTDDKPLQFSILSLPSENSTRTMEQTGDSELNKPIRKAESSSTSMFSSSDDSESSSTKTLQKGDAPKLAKKSKKKSKSRKTPQKIQKLEETKADLLSSNLADLSKTDGPPVNAKCSGVNQVYSKTDALPLTSHKLETPEQPSEDATSSSEGESLSSASSRSRTSLDGKPAQPSESFEQTKSQSETGSLKPEMTSEIHPLGTSLPESTWRGLTSSQEPFSTLNLPLLPDDRPTLIQEVTKAREEARKWFTEVTQSDRDRRELSRRLEALENELVRLKNVEDRYVVLYDWTILYFF